MTVGSSDRVILLHGLARSPRSMARLARALQAAGYDVINHGYASRRHDVATLAAQVRALLAGLPAVDGRTHLVGHSLGGLLIRAALAAPLPAQPAVETIATQVAAPAEPPVEAPVVAPAETPDAAPVVPAGNGS